MWYPKYKAISCSLCDRHIIYHGPGRVYGQAELTEYLVCPFCGTITRVDSIMIVYP